MPTVTVRLDDNTRDALQARADEDGLNISDFLRELIRAELEPVHEQEAHEGFTPASLTPKERHTLSLLHRILARVLPEDSRDVDGDREYQLERAKVLEAGFTQEYWTEFAGIDSELSKRDAQFVMDVLDFFRMVDASVAELQETEPVPDDVVRALRFRGFDHNHPLEHKMADYAKFLVEDGRWDERAAFFSGPERGNSHHPTIATYSRLLAEYRRIREDKRRKPSTGRTGRMLSAADLQDLAAARVHPENR